MHPVTTGCIVHTGVFRCAGEGSVERGPGSVGGLAGGCRVGSGTAALAGEELLAVVQLGAATLGGGELVPEAAQLIEDVVPVVSQPGRTLVDLGERRLRVVGLVLGVRGRLLGGASRSLGSCLPSGLPAACPRSAAGGRSRCSAALFVVVLTGGGSELTGLPEVARRTLARNVRNGRPMGIAGLPEIAKTAAFSTVAGMLIYPQVCSQEYVEPRGTNKLTGTDGYFARVGNWLRHSF